MSGNLPDGVTDAMIDREFGGDPRCVCGHRWGDHREPDNLADDPQALLDALRQIDKFIDRSLNPKTIIEVIEVLDSALTICDGNGCVCRKFEEREEPPF